MDEKEFNLKNPDSEVAFTTRTTRGYMTSDRLFLFSIDDGHLAWEYDKTTKTVLFECDCIKRGRVMLSDSIKFCLCRAI